MTVASGRVWEARIGRAPSRIFWFQSGIGRAPTRPLHELCLRRHNWVLADRPRVIHKKITGPSGKRTSAEKPLSAGIPQGLSALAFQNSDAGATTQSAYARGVTRVDYPSAFSCNGLSVKVISAATTRSTAEQ